MGEYYSNYEIAQMISARIGNEPIPFDSVYSICLQIYKELGGTEQDFDSIYEILLAILPLTDRIADKIIDDSVIVTNKTWSSYKINAELANAGFDVSIVQELPASGDIHTIYFVAATDGETLDVYDEYMYIDSSFEKIGSTRLDLTDYYTKSETNTLLSKKQDNLTAGTNIDISNNIISAKGYVYDSSTGSFALNYKNAHLAELNTASGENSYAEGEGTTASGYASHTEGGYTTASGDYSHAEGVNSIASGDDSHAEGNATASGDLAHAEGFVTQAKGYTSHTEGFKTVANNYYEHAQGSNNISHTVVDGYDYVDQSTNLKTIHSIGIGIGNEHKNAEEIMLNGDMYIYGVGNYDGIHIKGQTGAPANTQTLQEVISGLKTDVSSKQNILSAGTHIDITNNVISVEYEVATNEEIDLLFGITPTQPNDEIWYTSEDGVITPNYTTGLPTIVSNTYNNGKGVLKFATDLTSIEEGSSQFDGCEFTSISLPNSLTNIPYGFLQGCEYLESVSLPNNLTLIDMNAFAYCSSLTSIDIPEGVEYIVESAFQECYALASVTLHNGLLSIGSAVFNECSFASITIPSTVTYLGAAFSNCNNLTSITCEATTPPELESDFEYVTNLAHIYVPAESVNTYKAATIWSDYASIIEAIQ